MWLYDMFLMKAPELEHTHSPSHQEVDDMGYITGKCNPALSYAFNESPRARANTFFISPIDHHWWMV